VRDTVLRGMDFWRDIEAKTVIHSEENDLSGSVKDSQLRHHATAKGVVSARGNGSNLNSNFGE
jgi:hypothetical protein